MQSLLFPLKDCSCAEISATQPVALLARGDVDAKSRARLTGKVVAESLELKRVRIRGNNNERAAPFARAGRGLEEQPDL